MSSELAPTPGGPAEPTLVTVGDIVVTQTWVSTPSSARPRREVSWTVTPMYQTSTGIPTWAIVCAVIFFVFCLLGLLFLLAKEEKTSGHVQVTAQAPGFVHSTYIPVNSQHAAMDIAARVDYIRALGNAF